MMKNKYTAIKMFIISFYYEICVLLSWSDLKISIDFELIFGIMKTKYIYIIIS